MYYRKGRYLDGINDGLAYLFIISTNLPNPTSVFGILGYTSLTSAMVASDSGYRHLVVLSIQDEKVNISIVYFAEDVEWIYNDN